MNYLSVIEWGPLAVYGVVFFVSVYFYWQKKTLKMMIFAAIFSILALAVLKSFLQYRLWSENELGRILLKTPLAPASPSIFARINFFTSSPLGYFLYYALSRFWFKAIASLVAALAFYGFLKVLERAQPRFFQRREIELGLVICLLCGWPYFLLFLPLVFLLAVAFSLYRLIFLKRLYVTLDIPLILSFPIIIIFGRFFGKIFHLSSFNL